MSPGALDPSTRSAGGGPAVPRVLVDLSVAASGGAATYTAGFAHGLMGSAELAKDRIVVLFDHDWAFEHPDAVAGLKAVGVQVVTERFPVPGTWRARVLRGRTVARVVRDHGIEVAYFPRDVAPRLPVPTVVLLNNRYAWASFATGQAIGGRLPALLLRVAARLTARRAAAVLAVSASMAESAGGAVVDEVVYHGCSLPEHPRPATVHSHVETTDRGTDRADGSGSTSTSGPGDAPPVQVLMVGNLIENKQVEVVIKGVAAARARRGAWELRVHGTRMDPDYADRVQALATRLLGPEVIKPPIGRDDLIQSYQRADILVMGGAFESFCHPLVEGMRSGCVVVAPDTALVREICGDVAVTYSEGDPSDLARALETAMADRDERSRRGIERSREFTWERTVAQTVAITRSVATARTRG